MTVISIYIFLGKDKEELKKENKEMSSSRHFFAFKSAYNKPIYTKTSPKSN